jgi:transcriptional regulator with XRE-family HTH domain
MFHVHDNLFCAERKGQWTTDGHVLDSHRRVNNALRDGAPPWHESRQRPTANLIADSLSSAMTPSLDAARILREARARAGLSQRELARRAGTSQSVVSRIESGATSPSADTLRNLVAAAGFEVTAALAPLPVADSHMLADVRRILALTPEQRLVEIRNIARFERSARRV